MIRDVLPNLRKFTLLAVLRAIDTLFAIDLKNLNGLFMGFVERRVKKLSVQNWFCERNLNSWFVEVIHYHRRNTARLTYLDVTRVRQCWYVF